MSPSINNKPVVNNISEQAFYGTPVAGPPQQLVTGSTGSFNGLPFATDANPDFLVSPMISDNGNIVVRAGTTNTSPIRLYNYTLSTSTAVDIATISPTTFSALGRSPGISDDGSIVVFYGVLNQSGTNPNINDVFETTAGPGIFASFHDGTVRRTVRIARRQIENISPDSLGNFDGVCDSWEQMVLVTPPPASIPQCIDGELGQDDAGNPIQFSSFDLDARIGVIHQDLAPLNNIEGDTFVVSFIGTPSGASSAPQYFSNQRGLWTIKVDLKTEDTILREKPSRPMSVVQIGDSIGSANQIANLSVFDPIARAATPDAGGPPRVQRPADHRVAFQATTQSGGIIIVRGTYIDSDEDSLPDHWEISGIDFDQDGDSDLALNIVLPGDEAVLAAHPNRKDVYVEIDYMQETGGASPHTHRPGRLPDDSALLPTDPLLQVRNAFRAAPARNADGSTGITLHTFPDEPLPEINSIQFGNGVRPTGVNDDFDDFKFGRNGSPAGTPCGIGPNDGHFGLVADRRTGPTTPNPNCHNILGAKRLVFRYAIFAHRIEFPPDPPDLDSGVGEISGNDFVVSLAVREIGVNDWEDRINALVGQFNGTVPVPNPQFTFETLFSDFQAGTFMHELGHTLGLRHGGNVDLPNCKPNYHSVMNYSRQFNRRGRSTFNLQSGVPNNAWVLSNRRLDYARRPATGPAWDLLNETSLFETRRLKGPAGERIVHGRQIATATSTAGSSMISAANGQMDWNTNGSINSTLVAADVNWLLNVNRTECGASPGEFLTSHDDWSNLRYNFYSGFNFVNRNAARIMTDETELDAIDALNGGLGSSDADLDEVLNQNDNCIFAPNSDQSDSNSNGVGDVCDPLTTSLADIAVTMVASAEFIQKNTPFDYVATIRNDGGSVATSVVFANSLPAGAAFVSVTPSQGTCTGTTNISCNLGMLLSESTSTVTIRLTSSAIGKLDNYAEASDSITLDPNILNNDGAASATIFDPTQTFTISGTVEDINGVPVSGVSIGYDGTQEGSVLTDSSGNYSISVASGGIYDLLPSKYGFAFDPPGSMVPYIASNEIIDFTALDASASVSGRVLNPNGGSLGQARVTITDANGAFVAHVLTSSFGYYNFGTIAIDQTYTVSVSKKPYSFTPQTIFVFEDLGNIDFAAQW